MRVPDAICVVAHPRKESFTHAVADRAIAALSARAIAAQLIDLYADNFDPVLNQDELARRFSFDPLTQRYTRAVSESSYYVFVHPDWWGGPPAMMKGFIERVFRAGIAYEWQETGSGEMEHAPLLRDRTAAVLITSDAQSPAPSLQAGWDAVFRYCGVVRTNLSVFGPVHGSTLGDRRRWLDEAAGVVSQWGLKGGEHEGTPGVQARQSGKAQRDQT